MTPAAIKEFIELLYIEGDSIIIPQTPPLPKKVFDSEIKKPLVNLGGEWNRSVHGFTFPFDPTISLEKLRAGATMKLRSKFHYFDTPVDLVGSLVHFGEENHFRIYELPRDARIIEPGAGQGNILKYLNTHGFTNINHCELMEENRMVLDRVIERYGIKSTLVSEDFLKLKSFDTYDFILANPPFREERKHLKHMLKLVKPGGTILSITSPKIETDEDFQNEIFEAGGDWFTRELLSDPEDPIFEGTNIGCCLMMIRKRKIIAPVQEQIVIRKPIAKPIIKKENVALEIQGSLF